VTAPTLAAVYWPVDSAFVLQWTVRKEAGTHRGVADMSTWTRLEYDNCPSCGAAALIETERMTTGPDSEPRVRITRIECTYEECLHFFTALQPI
jgi:hypothetical protein